MTAMDTTFRTAPSGPPTLRKLVVIGNGMAGARTVEEILARDGAQQFAITLRQLARSFLEHIHRLGQLLGEVSQLTMDCAETTDAVTDGDDAVEQLLANVDVDGLVAALCAALPGGPGWTGGTA